MNLSQKIIDYAIFYYLKYYPSPKKLALKLREKFWEKSENWQKYWGIGEEEIDYIIKERLKDIIQEDEVIQSKIRYFVRKGKSKLYIRQKLFERQEDKDLIDKYIMEAFEEWEVEQILKEYEKVKWRYEDKKIFEKLYRKGFKYDDINKVMWNFE